MDEKIGNILYAGSSAGSIMTGMIAWIDPNTLTLIFAGVASGCTIIVSIFAYIAHRKKARANDSLNRLNEKQIKCAGIEIDIALIELERKKIELNKLKNS